MNMPPESAEVATLAGRKAFPLMARVTAEAREDSRTAIAECARYYKSHDWSPIPVRSRTKQPTVKGWQNLEISEEQIESYFHNDSNIGLRLGEPSGWLVDIDLDAGQAVSLADRFLPKTSLIPGRPGKLRSHYWYVAPESQTEKFKDVDATMLVELRSTGAQTVVPPSIHPSGEELFWNIQEEPAPLDCHELRKAVAELAACALVSRHWFPKDNRNAGAMALAGYLLRHGIDEYRVVKFIEGAACIAGDEETSARVRTTLGTATKLAAGGRVTGGPTLETLLSGDGSAVVERLSEWMGLEGSPRSSQPSEWPDPQTLPEGLLPVPALQDVMVPEPLRPWIVDITERMQCPLEFATVGAVVAIASLIGRRLAVRPKRQDDWQVVPNLWGGVVGRPGIMKSPALAEAIKPLHRLERRGRELYEAEIKEFETRRIAIKAKKADIESQIKTAVKQGGDPAVVASEFTLPSEQDDSPTVSRFIVNDPTIEKLGELLNENPRGLLLFRDELTGWLKSMEREGHESDRSFYLEGWGGTGSFTYDRIGRGTIHVDSVCVSILGGIQPGPLAEYLRSAMKGGKGADGLIQRLQLLVYPDDPGTWRNVDRWPDTDAKNKAFEILEAFSPLADLETSLAETVAAEFCEDGGIPFLRFSEEAQEFFDGWRNDLENRIRSQEDHPVIESHLSKYRSLMPSLALIFHLISLCPAATSPATTHIVFSTTVSNLAIYTSRAKEQAVPRAEISHITQKDSHPHRPSV